MHGGDTIVETEVPSPSQSGELWLRARLLLGSALCYLGAPDRALPARGLLRQEVSDAWLAVCAELTACRSPPWSPSLELFGPSASLQPLGCFQTAKQEVPEGAGAGPAEDSNSGLPFCAVWPWISYLASLGSSFLIRQMRTSFRGLKGRKHTAGGAELKLSVCLRCNLMAPVPPAHFTDEETEAQRREESF